MAHDVADQDVLLARLRELGPVRGHGSVEVELAPVVEHEGAQERHRLGRRPDVGDGVALPGPRLVLVGPAAPDVDDRLAVHEDGDGRAEVFAPVELVGQRRAHGLEARFTGAEDLCHARTFLAVSGGTSTGLAFVPVRPGPHRATIGRYGAAPTGGGVRT